MSFTGPEDPAYLLWAADKGRLGRRVPSWKQANNLLNLARERKEKNERLRVQEEQERERAYLASRAVQRVEVLPEAVVSETPEAIFVVVPREADPEAAVSLVMRVAGDIKTFTYYRWDSETGLIERSGVLKSLSVDNVKDVVFGNYWSQRLYEGNDGEVIVLGKGIGAESDFSLRDSVNSNCVLDAIRNSLGSKVEKKLELISKRHSLKENGVSKAIMTEIARELRVRLVVYTCVDSCWFDTDPGDKGRRKKIEFFACKNHAEKYREVSRLSESTVAYVSDFSEAEAIHARKLYYCKLRPSEEHCIGEVTPDAIRVLDRVYKTFRPSSVSGDAQDDLCRDYFLCTGKEQFLYKKWVKVNRLRPLEGVYFSIFKNANTYLGSRIFSTEKCSNLYDMNRAYPSFRSNPLYSRFELIVGNVCLYDTSNALVLDVVGVAGVSLVSEITWHNKFVESCGWIREGVFANHIILYTLVREGWASIKIACSVICRKTEDLCFPFGADKRANNAFIGRLIAGAQEESSGCKVEYTRVYSGDIDQVMYDLSRNPDCLGSVVYPGVDDSKYVCATMKTSDKKKQLYQIHGCILAYQQVTMMKAMVLASRESFVVGYNTDGFHVRSRISLELSSLDGGWKYENKDILYSGGNVVHTLFSESIDVGSLPLFEEGEKAVTLLVGPAGCGKSYNRIEVRHGGAVVCCPTNELVMNTSKKTPCKVMTYHRYFGLHTGGNYADLSIDEVVVIDEVSMMPGADLLQIVEMCSERRVCLDLIGDVRLIGGYWDTDQMRPVNFRRGDAVGWHDAIMKVDFTWKEVISDVRRQSAEDCLFIDSLRGLGTAAIREKLIERFGVCSWADINRVGLGVSARHCMIGKYNESIVEKWNPSVVVGRCLKNTVKGGVVVEAKGMIQEVPIASVWRGRVSSMDKAPMGCKYELAYFRTSYAVQGQSIGEEYIIDISGDARFLYTAVSRCRSLDLIRLVDSTKDFPIPEDEFD